MPLLSTFTCSFNGLTIHAIAALDDQTPLHLSFSKERHDRAAQWLLQRGSLIAPASAGQRRPFCASLLAFWQGASAPDLPPASPFFSAGTQFQQRVWQLICSIPFGQTATYGELARRLGNVRLSRAVGQACNANPLALYIPCHRVVGARQCGGFAGGPATKRQLLALEQRP